MEFDKEITCRVCLKENKPKVELFDSGGLHLKILTNTIGVEVGTYLFSNFLEPIDLSFPKINPSPFLGSGKRIFSIQDMHKLHSLFGVHR